MNTYLEIQDLSKNYGAVWAIEGISLALARGQVLAVLGPNGAGKSTLFGCLLGFTRPTAGRIRLDGRAVTDLDRASFGYAAERVALYSQRTVLENASFFAALKGQSQEEAERQLERVGLAEAGGRKASQLSKGMLQRLGLAIALCGEPQLLVLDEPFNGLDPALLGKLQRILGEEQSRGATLLVSTHTISAIEPLATQVAILLEGKLAAFAKVEELRSEYGDETSLETVYREIALRSPVVEETCV